MESKWLGLAKEKSPIHLQGVVLLTGKGHEQQVKKIADSAKLFIAVRFRAGYEELKDISKSLSLVINLLI